jgi:hypothetical protein
MVYDGVYNFTARCCDTGGDSDVCTNADTCTGGGPDTDTRSDCDANANSHADASFDSVVR